MSKGERLRSGRERSELIGKRQRRTLEFFKSKIGERLPRHEVDADQFVKDMRKARTEVPGATQEIPKINEDPAWKLWAMSRDDLRRLAAERNIKGRGSMNKEQLIKAIEATE